MSLRISQPEQQFELLEGAFGAKRLFLLIDCVIQFRRGMHNENLLFRNDARELRMASGFSVPACNYFC